MQATVGVIGKAHGLRGEVSLIVRTDNPDERFTVGTVFQTVPTGAGPLTVESVRSHQGRLLVAFEEILDRTAAEEARGVELVIDATSSDEQDAWYPHELVGLEVRDLGGAVLGKLTKLEFGAAHDFLEIQEPGGSKSLVPFVAAIVPEVNVPAGYVVINPPAGLLAESGGAPIVVENSDAD